MMMTTKARPIRHDDDDDNDDDDDDDDDDADGDDDKEVNTTKARPVTATITRAKPVW